MIDCFVGICSRGGREEKETNRHRAKLLSSQERLAELRPLGEHRCPLVAMVLRARWTQFLVCRVWVLEKDPHSFHLEQQMRL